MGDLKNTPWAGIRISRRRLLSYALVAMAGVAGVASSALANRDTISLSAAEETGVKCPKCGSINTIKKGEKWFCNNCKHEW